MDLDDLERRVLGSLLEKERTVPATYPLTLNALRTACNQTSGRDPVMDVAEYEAEWFDRPVDVDFRLHERAEVLAAVAGAALAGVEWYVRSPNPDLEAATERLYVVGRRP